MNETGSARPTSTSGPTSAPARTPLHALHEELGARLVPFAGYAMPLHYVGGIIQEHMHTRRAAGLFDVSHMGQILVSGADAAAALETLMPADLIDLPVGRQRYTFLTNDAGGVLDDLMIANLGTTAVGTGVNAGAGIPATAGAGTTAGPGAAATAEPHTSATGGPTRPGTSAKPGGRFLLVVNAARKHADLAHLSTRLAGRCTIAMAEDTALLALQGPAAAEVIARLAPALAQLAFMSTVDANLAGVQCQVSRSGYAGEDGFEIALPAEHAEALARELLGHDEVAPVGLGARDSLRLEAGLCLYGQDLDEQTTPVEADLGWALSRARRPGGARPGGYPGAGVIARQLTRGVARRRVGIAPDSRVPVRAGCELTGPHGERVGTVTSGGFGPSVGAGTGSLDAAANATGSAGRGAGAPVAMGYVASACAEPGTRLTAIVRGKPIPVRVTALPFTPHRYRKRTAGQSTD